MKRDFLVESRAYDLMLRGSWQAYRINAQYESGDELNSDLQDECVRLWLPAGTLMHWASGTHAIRNNCIQFFWPQRWFMLSAFYQGNTLLHTYANIIQPATIQLERISYIDLDLSILFEPDASYEVLTQAEFDHLSQTLQYDEQTRIGALMALQTLTSTIQRSIGPLSFIPYSIDLSRLHIVRSGN